MEPTEQGLDQPPPYQDLAGNPDDILEPATYILAGQAIHIDTTDSEPVYKLNRGIATLSYATTEVELKWVKRTLTADPVASGKAAPMTKQQVRHIYDIKHIKGLLGTLSSMPSDTPPFYIQSMTVTRKPTSDLANLALRKSRLRPGHWKALPVDLSGKSSKWNMPAFVKDSHGQKPVFEVRDRITNGTHQWLDGDGNTIALEDVPDDEGPAARERRLVVTAPLRRDLTDSLVALWCARLWRYSAEHQEPLHSGVEGAQRKFGLAKDMTGGAKMGLWGG